MASGQGTLSSRVSRLEELNDKQRDKIANLTANVDKLTMENERLTDSVKQITDLTVNLNATQKDLEILSDKFSEVVNKLNIITERMSKIEQSPTPGVIRVNERIDKLEIRVTELENRPAKNLKVNYDKYKGIILAAIFSGVGIFILNVIKDIIILKGNN